MWEVYVPDPVDVLIEDVVNELRSLIRKDSRSYADLAGDSKLNVGTIKKLADGSTRRPQLRTILRVAAVLPSGWKVTGECLVKNSYESAMLLSLGGSTPQIQYREAS